jgi:hypothetical protein
MSQADVLNFLLAARDDAAIRSQYSQRNLAQLLFHAKNQGYDFSADDVADVVGKLEANVILAKDRDQFDQTSGLWRQMWGQTHFDYVLDHVVARHTEDELRALLTSGEAEVR